MKGLYIGVVSHGHFNIIKKLGCLAHLSLNHIEVGILDNVGEEGFEEYCKHHGIDYLKNSVAKGFGENNNILFNYAYKQGYLDENGYFLVLNPDVAIAFNMLQNLVYKAYKCRDELVAINLFKNSEFTESDPSVRNFPGFIDFAKSLLLGVNPTLLDKSVIKERTTVDWAAGSFLLIKAAVYKRLNGFDERYFMYCEDLDICWRAKHSLGVNLYFYPEVKALHQAQHANRKIISKHFFWHIKSVFRYLLLKK
ncbi:glycosyltransferase family 2 protein [Pseudoalteromonas sp. MQS005]|uniref:glycosyltransferase family 2 protein n=1 Tax=Pseudoalteromonas sp. MQS005 TaxID=1854052 RepID=UPI0007E50550|nr:glycosyltransferase family 2 protein [Pseudoalteromonas sp. MQS005]